MPFSWFPETDAAFCHLKRAFTSALVLSHPDPWQFVVDVDTSDTSVGWSFHSAQPLMDFFNPVLSSPGASPLLKGTMMLATVNCWRGFGSPGVKALARGFKEAISHLD